MSVSRDLAAEIRWLRTFHKTPAAIARDLRITPNTVVEVINGTREKKKAAA